MNWQVSGQPRAGMEDNVASPQSFNEILVARRVDQRLVNQQCFHGIAGGWVVALGVQHCTNGRKINKAMDVANYYMRVCRIANVQRHRDLNFGVTVCCLYYVAILYCPMDFLPEYYGII